MPTSMRGAVPKSGEQQRSPVRCIWCRLPFAGRQRPEAPWGLNLINGAVAHVTSWLSPKRSMRRPHAEQQKKPLLLRRIEEAVERKETSSPRLSEQTELP